MIGYCVRELEMCRLAAIHSGVFTSRVFMDSLLLQRGLTVYWVILRATDKFIGRKLIESSERKSL